MQVKRFFENLLQSKSTVFNLTETITWLRQMCQLFQISSPSFFENRKKAIQKIESSERGEIVMAVCCVNPTGNFIPPAMIFPRKRMKMELYENAPRGTLALVSESGYMNSELFLNWLQHFVDHVKPCDNDPVLLILDNDASHCSLQAVEFCRNHHILLSLPPHSSHMMQPLDRVIFASFKEIYAQEVNKWLCSHPGRSVTLVQIAGLFKSAFNRIATAGKAALSFSCTGIYPYNPNVFSEEDFLQANVTH
mgnify:CR=1 FL=1